MRSKRVVRVILALTLVWMVGWTLLHFVRPRTFPWMGLPIGLMHFALILVMNWFDWPR